MKRPLAPPYAPETRERVPGRGEVPEHRCSRCYGPYGKSAIRCVNEPDWYDTHCPTCDSLEPAHTTTCAVPYRADQNGEQNMTETDYGKLIEELREYGRRGFGANGQLAKVPYGVLYRVASAIEALLVDREEAGRPQDQLDRALDVLNIASWRAPEGTLLGELLAPYRRPEHLLGRPAVEVEGDKSNE